MPKSKINCWEHHDCGRESGGHSAARLGVCPAATHTFSDGINHGMNAGRYCWAVVGSFSISGKAQACDDCLNCPFYQRVEAQEERFFVVIARQSAER